MSDDIHKEIDAAMHTKDLSKLMALTNLPADVITGQRVMSRKERRQWYRDNRVRLKLPAWGKLETLMNE